MLKINHFIDKAKKTVDLRLKELIEKNIKTCSPCILEMVNYSLFPGGKRLRPIALLSICETYQKDLSFGIDIACAIELIHTYSLIHDDMPCMDNDEIRRNKPTLHVKFSQAEALLIGDLLLTLAFQVIAESEKLTEKKKNEITSYIAKKSGCHGMIGGQYLDMMSENQKIDFEMLSKIHIKKTASLLAASFVCGGIICNATEKELKALGNFAKNIGFAYQIVDDILEASLESNKIGKSISDEKNKKATAVSILGIENAKNTVKELYEKGILNLSAIAFPPPLLKDFAYVLIKRKF